MSKTAIILALILSIQLLAACGGAAGNVNRANTNTAAASNSDPASEGIKDNTEEFATIAKLPFPPEEVTWKETSAGDNKKLLAVLRFTPDDSKKIVERASRIKAGETVSLDSEKWFPPELVAQSDLNGDDNISATAYPADEFYHPPYTEGRISRVDNTEFFVLELTAK